MFRNYLAAALRNLARNKLYAAINIVGLASWSSILDLEPATWEHDLAINLNHHLYVGRAAAKVFIADGTPTKV